MMQIIIDESLKRIAPDIALGVVFGKVHVTSHDELLWGYINDHINSIKSTRTLEDISNLPEVKALKNVYKQLGKDPSRYRGSQEALLRRIVQNKGLYKINTIVDLNNLISIKSLHSVGTYDISQLQPPIMFRIGLPGEFYKGIGKELINIENLPVFADQNGPFGSPTSDSERAMITTSSENIMIVII
ncbi:MAG TPA: hypothetical protein DEG92_04800, partial [Rikenellaceae bacterium]|nr:hypothetical protein [Rikenellaceae bacterium]